MRRIRVVVFMTLLLIQGCNESRKIDRIQIFLEQDSKVIKPANGVVELAKDNFNVILDLPKNMGVLVNASYNDSLFRQVSEGKVTAVFDHNKVLAVDLFNREATLYLAVDSTNAWYHSSEEEHTFNQLVKKNGGHRCTKTIRNIIDIDDSESAEIKNKYESIYLSVVGVDLGEQAPGAPFPIYQSFKIEWND